MRVAVLHNEVSATPTPDERDVLVQVEVVSTSLAALGHDPRPIGCTLDLAALLERLEAVQPDVVFSLVESLAGSDALAHLPAALLDRLGIPYTGATTEATFLSAHKLLAKERLAHAGVPTPTWVAAGGSAADASDDAELPGAYIIKSVREHASFGLGERSILCPTTHRQLQERLAELGAAPGRPYFAERYVEGREFNLALLETTQGVRVLPPAEIDFSAFPAGKPRIVDYRAKWAPESFEYQRTPRRYEFAAADAPLLYWLESLAIACWELFGLNGYARVDFRVDDDGQPWVLEVNSNPCLSPDAGYAAALAEAGISLEEAVAEIVAAALARSEHGAGLRTVPADALCAGAVT